MNFILKYSSKVRNLECEEVVLSLTDSIISLDILKNVTSDKRGSTARKRRLNKEALLDLNIWGYCKSA